MSKKRYYVTLVLTTEERDRLLWALAEADEENGCGDCHANLMSKIQDARIYTKTTAGGYPFKRALKKSVEGK